MQTWPEGVDRIVLNSVDSTMSEVRRRAGELSAPTWVLSHQQTKGTGRRGRAWDTGKGNFSASLLLRPNAGPQALALRSFVAALALFDALVGVTGREDLFALKWPNDVLLRGGKLAGILLETLPQPGNRLDLIVGIGINLKSLPPSQVLQPGAIAAKSLKAETGLEVTPLDFLAALAPTFDRYETQMQTYGFEPIRNAWLNRAANLGAVVTARIGNEEITGTFETVDETGALVIQTAQGRRCIAAGDVFFNEGTAHAAGH
ncbi:MAG: biotin--[acetyl-CoA-carboxylase] ligase [Rhodobacteraceae bacterium]|nr:biotin--[acetyl-CoA-carboxylase] ligase [Paracoccaceae bacterium]